MPFKIVRNDITKMNVDAVVNTANEEPVIGAGVDTAIYQAAGEEVLLAERRKIGRLSKGDVAITPGFDLPAKYIIHAVSPLYVNGESGEEVKLRSCYKKALELAVEHECKSIAFPLIATGSFGYPKDEAMRVAVDEIDAFLLKSEMMIYLVVFDAAATNLGKSLYPDLESYIDQNYVQAQNEIEYEGASFRAAEVGASNTPRPRRGVFANKRNMAPVEEAFAYRDEVAPAEAAFANRDEEFGTVAAAPIEPEMDLEEFWEEKDSALEKRISHLSDTFQEYLFYMIGEKGLSNAEVYKRAIITKQVFSKIKTNPAYQPNKSTAMRLCVGAKLNLDETKDLLARAGFALSPCDKSDIIFSYFIEKKVYDMVEIDIALEEYGLPHFIE